MYLLHVAQLQVPATITLLLVFVPKVKIHSDHVRSLYDNLTNRKSDLGGGSLN